mgnify:CR=1 FL=1
MYFGGLGPFCAELIPEERLWALWQPRPRCAQNWIRVRKKCLFWIRVPTLIHFGQFRIRVATLSPKCPKVLPGGAGEATNVEAKCKFLRFLD